MTQIAGNETYSIQFDTRRNRIYISLTGDLVDKTAFDAFPDELRATCRSAEPGFTVLGDFSGIGVFALPEVVETAQQIMLDTGVRKVATVWGAKLLGRLQTTQRAQTVGNGAYANRRQVFDDKNAAESWLDG